MHNVPALVSGHQRCVLLVHPDDAARAGVSDGQSAILENHVHSGTVTIELSNEMRPGVVSLPHGWGHAPSARWQRTAGANAGVSFNDWTDDGTVESVVGQSILNGVPVRLKALSEAVDAEHDGAALASGVRPPRRNPSLLPDETGAGAAG
jgi:anaerobic selenocysteine-containing dehydrogenase